MARMVKGCDRVWNVSLLCRTMGAPGRGCEAGGPAEGGEGRWCNGIFAIIGGKLPRDPSLGLSCNLAADSQGGGRG